MVYPEVTGHHTDVLQGLRTVAYDVHIAERGSEATVLDEPPFLHEEGEVAGTDLHLSVGESLGKDAAFYAAYDILLGGIAGTHIGAAHTRQGHVAETLATTVTRALYAKMAGTDAVVQIAGEDAFVHQDGALTGCTLVVITEHTGIAGLGAIVDNGDMAVADALAQLARENTLASADEVGLEGVPYGLVHEDAAAAGSEDNGHLATLDLSGIKEE